VTDEHDETVLIKLIDFPVALSSRAGRHYQAIQREFALIHYSDPATRANLPARLLEVVERTRNELESSEIVGREQFQEALARGDTRVTVDVRTQRSAGEAMAQLEALLLEADDFCREGDLLTIAMPPDCREFREWFLNEFVRQIAGEPPTPWTGPVH
jgi:hypothetical protein